MCLLLWESLDSYFLQAALNNRLSLKKIQNGYGFAITPGFRQGDEKQVSWREYSIPHVG